MSSEKKKYANVRLSRENREFLKGVQEIEGTSSLDEAFSYFRSNPDKYLNTKKLVMDKFEKIYELIPDELEDSKRAELEKVKALLIQVITENYSDSYKKLFEEEEESEREEELEEAKNLMKATPKREREDSKVEWSR
ncbi:MAG: hypothetical protein ACLFVL_00375 [Candidatus Aenigmatarchaeota archaeon]